MPNLTFGALLAGGLAAALCATPATAGKDTATFDKPETEAFLKKLNASMKAGNVSHVTAVSLGKEYASNEVAADQKYKGKYLFVAGTVDSVTKSMLGAITVRLRSSNQFLPADAYLDKTVAIIDGMEDDRSKLIKMTTMPTEQAAASLKKGQKVRLLCQGDGMVIGSPQLKVCDTLSR